MSNEAKLGLFVVAVLVVLLFFTINMGTIFFSKGERKLEIYFNDIGTLEKGAPVKQAGFDVGEVTNIAPKRIEEPTPTIYIVVEVSLSDEAILSPNSKASIHSLGMMGEMYLEITFGTQIEEGEKVERIEGQGPIALDNVMENAVSLAKNVEVTIQSFNKIFADEKLQKDITQLIANLENFSKSLNQLMGMEQERLNNIMMNLEVASGDLKSMMASSELFVADARDILRENREPIKQTLDNVAVISQDVRENLIVDIKEMSKDLQEFSHNLRGTTERANGVMARIETILDENKPNVNQAVNNIVEITENSKEASRKVDEILNAIQTKKGVVHDFIYDEELSKTTKSTLNNTSKLVDQVSALPERFSFITDLRYFPDDPRFDPDDNFLRADIGVQYDFSEQMYAYAGGNNLGAANDFELQFGYKWNQLAFHGGIIESEVGLGIDWHIMSDWMLGMEGLGFTSDGKERLDAYTEYRLWNELYLVGGVHDVTDEFFPNAGFKYRF